MFKKSMVILMVCLCLCLCLSSLTAIAEKDTDFQKDFHSVNMSGSQACKSDTGYYIIAAPYIYYLDGSSMECMLACGKIECAHNNQGCNAYVAQDMDNLSYHGGKLYYSTIDGGKVALGVMDLDGTNRRTVMNIGSNEGNFNGRYLLHRDNVYFLQGNTLVRSSLNGGKPEQIAIIDNLELGSETYYWADANMIYVLIRTKTTLQQQIYCYDADSGAWGVFWSLPSTQQVGKWKSASVGVNGWYIKDDCLYFYLSENGIWKYDSQADSYTCLVEIHDSEQSGYAYFSENYILIDSGNKALNTLPTKDNALFVYNYAGQFLNKIPYGALCENETEVSTVGIDGSYVFMWTYGLPYIDFTIGNTEYGVSTSTIYFTDITDTEMRIHLATPINQDEDNL